MLIVMGAIRGKCIASMGYGLASGRRYRGDGVIATMNEQDSISSTTAILKIESD